MQSSDDDEDQLYYNFVQHFKKGTQWRIVKYSCILILYLVSVTALRRDEFTLKDGEMGMQQERLSETESEEDIDDTDGSGSTLNTCKSAFNNFLSIEAMFIFITVYFYSSNRLT